MRDKYINIIIVTYGGKKAKSFRINKKVLKAGAIGTATALSGLLLFSFLSFHQNINLRYELAKLRLEHKELQIAFAEEKKRTSYLQKFQEKVEELEAKLLTIDKFLRKKGIRKIPSGVGGGKSKVDVIDIEYVSFLHKEADRAHKYLTRIPLGPPVWGRLTSKYGYRLDPFTRHPEFHNGVDLRAPGGTPVRATAAGKVIFAGWRAGYGKTVVLRHAYGYRTLYGHMSKIKVKKGQWVKSGDILGYVGSTGKSTGPHVHYEVWRYSKKENPLKYMYVRW